MCKKLFSVLCVCIFLFSPVIAKAEKQATPIKTAWLGEHETFLMWYAKEKGWDKELGLDVEMIRFNSGKEIIDKKGAYAWTIAALGAVPALTGTLNDEITIFGIANDESAANSIYVRADSSILGVKGHNPLFPNVYGSPETIRNKKILSTNDSSAQYLLLKWLKNLGLNEKDVHITFIEPRALLGAFTGGMGDIMALWAPYTYEAEKKGFKVAALSKDTSITQPILLVADTAFATANPEKVEKFLDIYLRAVNAIREKPLEDIVSEYQRFYFEWVGIQLTAKDALLDLQNHPIFTLQEQIKMFDNSQGHSLVFSCLQDIVLFYESIQAIPKKDMPRMLRLNNVTDVYLKAIQQ